ncbi:ATP-binding protein [Mycolicibacterium pulveris]|uniref:ATP-binding protein n=1 Tax=Mycolicibacterium pulveris TaxID=36813 RepID=UPI003CF0190F
MTDPAHSRSAIDDLLDRAVRAINSGDRATADALAGQVLAVDSANVDAEELLAAPADHGEMRRLTILFADLVDSTALSTRTELETYRTVVGGYRDEVLRIVNRYEGHIGNTKGDGLLAVFGHPHPHEDDVRRAVQAGLDLTKAIAALSERVRRRFGFGIDVRVGIHRGLVYLDTAQDDVYGLAANLAARMCSIAEPGTVAVSAAVERLVRDTFELVPGTPQRVKGIDTEVVPYRPVGERESTGVAPGPLVGRGRETAYLRTALAQAAAGTLNPPGVAFYGEPGIGKSRLAGAAVAMTDDSDVVLHLFGSPFHADVGLHPVRKLLERRCAITRSSKPEERLALLRRELDAQGMDAAAVPKLAPVLGISPDTGYDPAPAEGVRLHGQITDTVVEYLSACTRAGRGLVVAEDMHWFDASTTEVIRKLLESDLGNLLVVMTSRDRSSLPDAAEYQAFEVNPLSDTETDALISTLHPEMSPEARRTVRRRCDGVPLYIEEVVAKLKEQPDDSAESQQVPDTLYEALFARLRSSASGAAVVEAAATIGTLFDRALLRAVVALPADELDRVLTELCDATVLEPAGDNVWRFRHELLREVAAELPPPSIRQRLHGRVADALISASSQDWPVIAAQFEEAHRYRDAVGAYEQASAMARQRGALDEARRYLTHALDLLGTLAHDAERDNTEMNLRLRRGFLAAAAEGAGSSQTAVDFERCLQLCGTDPHADGLFATLMALFSYYVTRADFTRAQQIVDSLRVGVDAGREWWRAENLGGAATVAWFRGEFGAALANQEQADQLMAARDNRDVEAEWFMPHDPVVLGLCSLALARWVHGDLDGAEDALARSANRAEGLKFPQGPFSTCYLRYIQIWICLEAGHLDRAAALAADMIERATTHGFDQWAALGTTFANYVPAAAALAAGRLDAPEIPQAIAALTGWVQVCRFLGATVFVPSFDGHVARLLLASGRCDDARAQVTAGLQLADDTLMHYYDAELLRVRANTHPDPAAQRDDLRAAFDLARRQGAPIFALRAALDDYAVRGDAARQAVVDAVAMFAPDSSWPELARARAIL